MFNFLVIFDVSFINNSGNNNNNFNGMYVVYSYMYVNIIYGIIRKINIGYCLSVWYWVGLILVKILLIL